MWLIEALLVATRHGAQQVVLGEVTLATEHAQVREAMRSRSARSAVEVMDDERRRRLAATDRADVLAPMTGAIKRGATCSLPTRAAVLTRRHVGAQRARSRSIRSTCRTITRSDDRSDDGGCVTDVK